MSVILVKKCLFSRRVWGAKPPRIGAVREAAVASHRQPHAAERACAEREKFGFQDPTRAILSFLRVPGASRFLTQISTQTVRAT